MRIAVLIVSIAISCLTAACESPEEKANAMFVEAA